MLSMISRRLLLMTASSFVCVGAFLGLENYADRRLPPIFSSRTRAIAYSVPMSDADLGYAPLPGTIITGRHSFDGKDVYNVRYTIDRHGFRLTRGARACRDAVLFFGCSLTFGEGLEDAETLPSSFQREARRCYRALNFGYSGYGPHQMLRMLEKNRDRAETLKLRPRHAVYLALPDHVRRSAGLSMWDHRGPRYEIHGTSAVYQGAFHSKFAAGLFHLLLRWRLMRLGVFVRRPVESDVDRFVAIVFSTSRLLKRRYGCDLLVVLREQSFQGLLAEIPNRLRRLGIEILREEDAFPGGRSPALFIEHDGHPTGRYNRRLGAYIAERIAAIDRRPASPSRSP